MPVVTAAEIMGRNRESHRRLDSCAFLSRYPAGSVTLQDHMLHLQQLKVIYLALEQRAKELIGDGSELPSLYLVGEFSCRSESIQHDLDFLAPHVSGSSCILPATRDLSHAISVATEEQWVGHFLVRILGDLFGGQAIKGYVQSAYKRLGLPASGGGVCFYSFKKENNKSMGKRLKGIELEDEQQALVLDATAESFAMHEIIFDQAEAHRSTSVKSPCDCTPSLAIGITAALVFAAAVTSVAAAHLSEPAMP